MILYAIFKEMKDKNLTIYQLIVYNQAWEVYTLAFKTLDEAVTEFLHQFEEVYKIYDLYNCSNDDFYFDNKHFWISREITGAKYSLEVRIIEVTIEL